MDFLTDPRFSQYRSSTTLKKYFPQTGMDQLSPKDNLIYNLINSTEPTLHQKNSILLQKQQIRRKKRKNTILTTNTRFLLNKNSQRLSTIKSFFDSKKISLKSPASQLKTKKRTQGMRKQIIKLNQFTVGVEKFQKSIKQSKQKVKLLKSYNSMVGNHFERFQVNEDRTRKEIMEHEEIIKLMLTKNSEDDKVAYFNAVGEKKVKESWKSRAKSSGENVQLSGSRVSQLVLAEISTVNGYQRRCEERVSNAIEEVKSNGVFSREEQGRLPTEKANSRQKKAIMRERPFRYQGKNEMKESRFLKEKKRKSLLDKENKIQKNELNFRQPQKNIIKKGTITGLKQNIFNPQRISYKYVTLTHPPPNQTNRLPNQTDQRLVKYTKKSITHFQKRIKTAGSLDTSRVQSQQIKI